MAVINYKKLKNLRLANKTKNIVLCSGVFDLTHAGHALFLEDAKKQGDILVVGVGDDVSTGAMKGRGRPVLNQHVRLKIVDSLKPVDYSFACLTPQGHPLSLSLIHI